MRRSMPKESPAARRQKACAVPSPIWKHGSTKKPSKQEQNRERTIRISSRNSPTRSRRLEVSSGSGTLAARTRRERLRPEKNWRARPRNPFKRRIRVGGRRLHTEPRRGRAGHALEKASATLRRAHAGGGGERRERQLCDGSPG